MKKLRWLYNRLRVMTFAEVLFRFRRFFFQYFEKRRVENGWSPQPVVTVRSKYLLFGTDSWPFEQWLSQFKLDGDRLERYLSGEIDFFGYDFLDIGNPVRWDRDPVTGTVSPMTFGKSLDYRDDSQVGNVKFLWELGRHQHLVPVAVAFAVTGEERYRNYLGEQVGSWIEQNPYGMGIHWCSALEVSLRLISWSLVHGLLALREGEEGLFKVVPDAGKLGLSLYQQAAFVRNYLSLHSSANNHLIGELTGLWTACHVFDFGECGDKWLSFATCELERQARLQVYDDGVNKEQATYYHLWVLEYFLFIRLVATGMGKPFSADFITTTERMAGFLRSISPENGSPPQIGDADDGFVARFEPCWSDTPYEDVLAVFDCFDSLPARTQKAFWYNLLARNHDASDGRSEHWERVYPRFFAMGGYAILGNKQCHIVFDGGALGYLGIAAHGHADALSICMAIDGVWWLVDPGTYAYHSKAEWRDYFRGTSAHNTIKINNKDQSTMGGAFMWTHKANARIFEPERVAGKQTARASHDGYAGCGVMHYRECTFDETDNSLVLKDKIDAKGEVFAEINFHFSPEVTLSYDEKNEYWIAKHQNSSRQLIFILDKCWAVVAVCGQTNPILGWYSPALERKIRCQVLHGCLSMKGAFTSETRILVR